MYHLKHNSRDYIVSRHRKGKLELVDALTGKQLDLDSTPELLALMEHRHVPLDTRIVRLKERNVLDPLWLSKLRQRRAELRFKARGKGSRSDKGPRTKGEKGMDPDGHSVAGGSPKRRRSGSRPGVSKPLADVPQSHPALAHLPPELRAKILAAMNAKK